MLIEEVRVNGNIMYRRANSYVMQDIYCKHISDQRSSSTLLCLF